MSAQGEITEPEQGEKRKSPEKPDQPAGTATGGQEQKTLPSGSATPIPAIRLVQQPGGEPEQESSLNIVEVNDLIWEKTVEKGKTPVVVMFYSPACVFCHQMEPYFRSFAREFQGSVLFARLNIMTNQWTPERYGVKSTPTFKFFCDGKPVVEMVGAVYPAILKKTVDDFLVHGKECAKNSTAIDYEITGYG